MSEAIDPGNKAYEWWRGLQDNRAARARFSRASVGDALAEEAAHALYRALGGRWRLPRAAALAIVLAKVREHDGRQSFGRQIGRPTFEQKDEARLKPLRFKRLLAARDDEDLARAFRRAVLILDRTANVRDLAWLVLTWDDERTRARFTFDYYATPEQLAAPGEQTPPMEASA